MRRPSFLSARQRASALLFASVAAILLYAVRPADAAGPTADPASVTATSSAGSASASSTTTRPPAVYVPPLALPASTPPDPEVLARLAALPNAGLAGELANVAVSSPRVTALSDQRDSLVSSRKAASVAQSAAESRLVTLDNEFLRLTDERGTQQVAAVTADGLEQQARAEAGLFAEQATRVARFMDDVVVASYVAAGRFESPLQASAFTVAGRRENYSRDVLETKRKERARLVADQAAMDLRALGQAAFATRARRAIAVLDQSLAENRTSVRTSFEARDAAAAAQVDLDKRIAITVADIAMARRTASVTGLDLTLVVFDAFVQATKRTAAVRPACALDWPLLAAISRIESKHGTYGTSSVDVIGRVQPPIVGPPLNGVGFALITDTDGGRYDFDSVYDRAVGPMQFIPSSWTIFGQDGDGDGIRNPNNVYDATLAAAEHLCRSGADVSTAAGVHAAVYSYNQSEEYVSAVLTYRNQYSTYTAVRARLSAAPVVGQNPDSTSFSR